MLASSKILDQVVHNGFSLGDHIVRLCPVSVKTIELHGHDVPNRVMYGALNVSEHSDIALQSTCITNVKSIN